MTKSIRKCIKGKGMSDPWIESMLANAVGGVLATAIVGSAAYWRTRVPDISGVWMMTVRVDKSEFNPYKGMKITYIVMLSQRAGNVSGSAEKVYEISTKNPKGYHYQKSSRMQSRVSGGVLGNVFQRKTFQLLFDEAGEHRSYISTVTLRRKHAGLLVGTYDSTAANSSGAVTLTKGLGLYGLSSR